jgi:hypothetical protein
MYSPASEWLEKTSLYSIDDSNTADIKHDYLFAGMNSNGAPVNSQVILMQRRIYMEHRCMYR